MFCINQVEELKEERTTELDISEQMTLRSDFKSLGSKDTNCRWQEITEFVPWRCACARHSVKH